MKKSLLFFSLFSSVALLFFFWWQGSQYSLLAGGAQTLIALGRITGLLAVYSILMQFLLMGRSGWIEPVFGLDKLARVHRLNGYLSLLFILLHPVFITLGYARLGRMSVPEQFLLFLSSYYGVLAAFVAVVLFFIVIVSSVYIVRRRLRYEYWYFVHLTTYLAVILSWFHQVRLGGDFAGNPTFTLYWYALYALVFGTVLFSRFFWPLYQSWQQRFRVARVVPETEEVTSLYIEGRDLARLSVQAGQFVIVRFLTPQLWWEAHPFSLSALPHKNQLRLTIKSVGDFTQKIREIPPGTPVILEGPYGTFTTKSTMEQKKFLLIAGGIGITPLRALLEEMAQNGQDAVLLYSNQTREELVFKKELEILAKQKDIRVQFIMTRDPRFRGEKGRIDAEKIQRLVPDFRTRQVFVCGPPSMVRGIRTLLQELGVPRNQIKYERFAL